MSIVLCVVVVGSCIAVIARWAATGLEPATPRTQHGRGSERDLEHYDDIDGIEADEEPLPSALAVVLREDLGPRPPTAVAERPPVDRPDPVAPTAVPLATRSELAPPSRRPSPAEVARSQTAGVGIPRVRWWQRLRAATSLAAISITLGLLAAGTVGLVLFAAFSVLRSL